jgi:hypothetical protein
MFTRNETMQPKPRPEISRTVHSEVSQCANIGSNRFWKSPGVVKTKGRARSTLFVSVDCRNSGIAAGFHTGDHIPEL